MQISKLLLATAMLGAATVAIGSNRITPEVGSVDADYRRGLNTDYTKAGVGADYAEADYKRVANVKTDNPKADYKRDVEVEVEGIDANHPEADYKRGVDADYAEADY